MYTSKYHYRSSEEWSSLLTSVSDSSELSRLPRQLRRFFSFASRASLLAFLLTPAATFSLAGLAGAATWTGTVGGSQSSSEEDSLVMLSTSFTARTFLCFSGGSFFSTDLDRSLFTSSNLL